MKSKKLFIFSFIALLFLAPVSALALNIPNQNMALSVRVGQSVETVLPLSPSGEWLVFNQTGNDLASGVAVGTLIRITGNSAGLALFEVCSSVKKSDCYKIQVEVTNGIKGLVLGISTDRHAVGSWVKLQSTVFYVHERGLIPVPSMKVFENNGGKIANIEPMTQGDQQLPPYLPELGANDIRVE